MKLAYYLKIFKNLGVVGLEISTFRKPRLKDYEFQTSLGYIDPVSKTSKTVMKKIKHSVVQLCSHDYSDTDCVNAVDSCCIKQGPGDMRRQWGHATAVGTCDGGGDMWWRWGHGTTVALFTVAHGAYEHWLSQNRSLLGTLWSAPLNTTRQYIVVSWGHCRTCLSLFSEMSSWGTWVYYKQSGQGFFCCC